MNSLSKTARNMILLVVCIIAISSCQKIVHPALPADYPKDTNPPGGPLKFYVGFDGTAVDSIRANFGSENNVTYVDGGVSGKAYQGSPTTYIQYGKANDFASSTSFTVAFWLKKKPQPAGTGTNFVFALNAKDYSWTNLQLFLEFEDAGNPSTLDSAAAKFYILDQWFEFIKNSSKDTRLPKVLDGNWHHLAFTYDEATSKLLTYIDGNVYLPNRADVTNVLDSGSPRGALRFTNTSGFTLGGPGKTAQDANGWMGNFDGQLDQFRLYNTALSAADIQALYNNKE